MLKSKLMPILPWVFRFSIKDTMTRFTEAQIFNPHYIFNMALKYHVTDQSDVTKCLVKCVINLISVKIWYILALNLTKNANDDTLSYQQMMLLI